jgi:hypothetical protein
MVRRKQARMPDAILYELLAGADPQAFCDVARRLW